MAVGGCRLGLARKLEDMDAEEGDHEAGNERDGVRGIVGVESLEENERSDDGRGREADVIHGIDTTCGVSGDVKKAEERWTYTLVEKMSRALLK